MRVTFRQSIAPVFDPRLRSSFPVGMQTPATADTHYGRLRICLASRPRAPFSTLADQIDGVHTTFSYLSSLHLFDGVSSLQIFWHSVRLSVHCLFTLKDGYSGRVIALIVSDRTTWRTGLCRCPVAPVPSDSDRPAQPSLRGDYRHTPQCTVCGKLGASATKRVASSE